MLRTMTPLHLKPLAPLVMLLALCAVFPTNAQKISWGSCPSVTGITTFDQAKFVSHVWYEAQRYDNLVEFGKRCVTWQFAATSATVMTATTTMKDLFGNTQTVVGTLTQGTPVAKFAYSVTQLPGLGLGIPRNFDVYILATDETFVVLWGCINKFLKNEQLLWVLTSTRTPTTTTLTTARAAVRSRGLDISRLTSTSQTNC